MTKDEKRFLADMVKKSITKGDNLKTIQLSLEPLGFKPATIRKYYTIAATFSGEVK